MLRASGIRRPAQHTASAPGSWVGLDLVWEVMLLAGAVAMVAPFLWMIIAAFETYDQIVAYPPVWIPQPATLENFQKIVTEINLARMFFNSLVIATAATTLTLLTSSLAGYVFAKFDFRGRDTFFVLILATMMLPWAMLLLPQYQIVVWLKLINTPWALVLPGAFSTFGIFLMRQGMFSLPDELLDAARIDGASEWTIFLHVVLPLSGPSLAALGIFSFMGNWDSFLWPLVVISSKELYTLPLGLALAVQQYWTDYGMVMAGATVAVIPVLLVYLFFQRWFVAGIALTGLKG